MTGDAQIVRIADRGMISVKLDPADEGWDRLGLAAPETRRATFAGVRSLWWMAPDERLLHLPRAEAAAEALRLDAALAPAHCLVSDMSDARAVFRLTGPAARETLAKGAPVDLARGAFGVGDVRRTHLGQIAVAFAQVSAEPETFELLCFRSVADHVEAWLRKAAAPEARVGWL